MKHTTEWTILLFTIIFCFFFYEWQEMADAQVAPAGALLITHADVACPQFTATANATPGIALAVSTVAPGGNTPPRKWWICCNVTGTQQIRLGDSSISNTQGIPIAAATGACVSGPGSQQMNCWGISGTPSISCTEAGQ